MYAFSPHHAQQIYENHLSREKEQLEKKRIKELKIKEAEEGIELQEFDRTTCKFKPN